MKLILAIVSHDDANGVIRALTRWFFGNKARNDRRFPYGRKHDHYPGR